MALPGRVDGYVGALSLTSEAHLKNGYFSRKHFSPQSLLSGMNFRGSTGCLREVFQKGGRT